MRDFTRTTHFSRVPDVRKPRSKFPRNKSHKTSFNSSLLYPIYLEEVYPGDTVNLEASNFVRMNPTVTPFMDNLYIDMHFFFVPTRLVWDNWERFNGQQDDPGDSTDFLIPVMHTGASGVTESTVQGHFGIPMYVPDLQHSALPMRCYNKIWNDWFRDQDLQNSAPVNRGDGPDNGTDYNLLPRSKFADYFTTARPWPQKGPSVLIPMAETAPVSISSDGTVPNLYGTGSGASFGDLNFNSAGGDLRPGVVPGGAGNQTIRFGTNTGLEGELVLDSTVVGTMNALRQAEAIQVTLERDARGGTRYIEMISSHFGVDSPDGRLQRSEYLCGNSVPISQVPVLQTSESGTTPQGNLAGMGTMNSHNARFIKGFTEHGYIIGLASARSSLHYQSGLERLWSRRTRFDFYLPSLAHLGEQAILNKEIYAQGSVNPTADEAVFGYTERWAELKSSYSQVTGSLNSNVPSSLDVWHLAQDFTSLPGLNQYFVKDGTPELRVLSVPTESAFVADFRFESTWTRVMPMFSNPGISARF